MLGLLAAVGAYLTTGQIIPVFVYLLLLSASFYDFPSSPILIIGAIGFVVALAVFSRLPKVL